jgi:acyl-homoserine lactone acylase PvdQ
MTRDKDQQRSQQPQEESEGGSALFVHALSYKATNGAVKLGGLSALYGLNRAQNVHEAREAVKLLVAPNLNIGFADIAGNIGYQLGGRVPVRGSTDDDGVVHLLPRGREMLMLEGWSGKHEWTGFVRYTDFTDFY